MNREKEFDQIVKALKDDYGWDLDRLADKAGGEALVDYTIKAIKSKLINTPQHIAFEEAMKAEMAHHIERYGSESGVPPHHFNMVLSYINGKLAKAIWDMDSEKFEHHLVTIASVAGTAMKYLKQEHSQVSQWFKKNP